MSLPYPWPALKGESMNKPDKIIKGKPWKWFREYRSRADAERLADRLRLRGTYVRVIADKEAGTFNLYGRPGRPWGRSRP